MVKINEFSVEAWMDKYEHDAKYNIAETCCASISLDELQSLSHVAGQQLLDTKKPLTYGAIRGSDALRDNLARLYSAKTIAPLPAANILTTPGAIAANYLVAYTLIGPGDHVICHHPTYQSLYEVPKQLGASIDLWHALPENQWIPTIDDLTALIKPNTKLIIINNPNNPTGAVLKKSFLQQLLEIASQHGITIMSDEVYRPIFYNIDPTDNEFPPSILSLGYENVIATGSMSKAYALAGIRVGWIASRSTQIIEKIAAARHYTTISVSMLDEQIAAFALDAKVVNQLLSRNIQLAKTNFALMDRFMIKNDDCCDWVAPSAGTTCFVRFHREGRAVDSRDFCEKLFEQTGAMVVPGSTCFGPQFAGYVRIGFVNHTGIVREGLDQLTKFVRKHLEEVKLADEAQI